MKLEINHRKETRKKNYPETKKHARKEKKKSMVNDEIKRNLKVH